jgi:hypothetical protein
MPGTGSDLDYLIRGVFGSQYGDANLDRQVDFDDLLILAQNYNTGGMPGWGVGNFDGSPSIGFDDLLLLAQHYGFGTASLTTADFERDWALAWSLVPEPAALAGLLGTLALPRRRPPGA